MKKGVLRGDVRLTRLNLAHVGESRGIDVPYACPQGEVSDLLRLTCLVYAIVHVHIVLELVIMVGLAREFLELQVYFLLVDAFGVARRHELHVLLLSFFPLFLLLLVLLALELGVSWG